MIDMASALGSLLHYEVWHFVLFKLLGRNEIFCFVKTLSTVQYLERSKELVNTCVLANTAFATPMLIVCHIVLHHSLI